MTAFRLCLIATLALGALASAAPPLDLAEEVAMEGTVSCKANTYYCRDLACDTPLYYKKPDWAYA
jgi:hypothetical protein